MRTRLTVCLTLVFAMMFFLSLVHAASPPTLPEFPSAPGTPDKKAQSSPRSIPAGAAVVVRTDEQIAVGAAKPGDIFQVTLDEDIEESGRTLVRRGGPAEIRLTKVREDRDELAFQLYTITVDGKKVRVVSDTAREVARKEAPKQQPGLGGVGKDLLGQAGSAALGGALGAKPGAFSWSGANLQDAKVPAGTFLEFTLREQVILK